MEITYLGHSSFKLKGKTGIVVTDPFDKTVGISMPKVSADIVTISHGHGDHNFAKAISGTVKRPDPWVVNTAGEYEISGISIFGYETFHDGSNGKDRGKNVIYKIVIDGFSVVHLGDLGHVLSDDLLEQLGSVDVLLCPVGGEVTIDPETAVEVISDIEPSYVIPMHYKTNEHAGFFSKLKSVEEFEKVYGVTSEPVKSLSISTTMPEQTTLVVLSS